MKKIIVLNQIPKKQFFLHLQEAMADVFEHSSLAKGASCLMGYSDPVNPLARSVAPEFTAEEARWLSKMKETLVIQILSLTQSFIPKYKRNTCGQAQAVSGVNFGSDSVMAVVAYSTQGAPLSPKFMQTNLAVWKERLKLAHLTHSEFAEGISGGEQVRSSTDHQLTQRGSSLTSTFSPCKRPCCSPRPSIRSSRW